jgi:protease secretion system outer membrane protein
MSSRKLSIALHGAVCACVLMLAGPVRAVDLLEAYRLATAGDAQYLAAQATAAAAQEALPQARAGLLPQISASASRSQNDTDQTTRDIFGQPVTKQYNYFATSAAVSLRQPLFRLGNVAHYLQAEAQVSSAAAILDKEGQDVAVRVASAYFDVLVARERCDALQTQKDAYAAQLAGAEHSSKAGFGTRTDIDEARARHDMAIAQEIEAKHNLKIVERTLAGILNQTIKPETLATIDAERLQLEPPQPDSIETWLTQAEEQNPEMRAMRSNIEVAEREVDKGRAAHLPTLDLVASRSKSDSENNNTIGNLYWTSSVGLQLNIPLYSGGQVSSAIRQARANLERARQQYEAGRRQLAVNLTRDFGAVSQGVPRVRALEQALRSAEQLLLSTRKGVQAGTRNSVDILNAVQQVASARLELAQARATYAMGRLKLKASAGTLGEDDIATVNRWLALN